MPLAPVDNHGTALFYEDSGIPNAKLNYTTLVLIHGIAFTSDIFKKLFPLASQHNLRLIRVNQRDYTPSSPFTDSEVEDFTSTDKGIQARALGARGTEIANLLVYLVDTLKLPPKASEGVEGGISVLGWSLGAHLPIGLLSSASSLPIQVQQRLHGYLRSVVLLDPSIYSIGLPIPPIVYSPERPKGLHWLDFDQSLSPEERQRQQVTWGSSYFQPTEDISTLTLTKLGERLTVQDLSEEVFSRLNIEPWKKVPTLLRFEPQELSTIILPEAAARSYQTLCLVDSSVHRSSFNRAIGLANSLPSDGLLVWPECKLLYVWCDMTVVDCTIAASGVATIFKDHEGNIKRQVIMERLPGANHFSIWDEPEKVISFLAKRI